MSLDGVLGDVCVRRCCLTLFGLGLATFYEAWVLHRS